MPVVSPQIPLFGRATFTQLSGWHLICQPHANINLRTFIEKRKHLLVKLPVEEEAYRDSAQTIGMLLMAMIYAATFSFSDMDKRPGFTLIVDEFQNFATDENAKLFSGGRKYGAKQFLAHQYQGQLVAAGLGAYKEAMTSANSIVAFSTSLDDSRELARAFKGLGHRPTNFERDIVIGNNDALLKHSNAIVREFYWDYLRPLQEVAKMRLLKDQTAIRYNFGYEKAVSLVPKDAELLLEKINDFLYYAQKNGSVDTEETYKLVLSWLHLIGGPIRVERERREDTNTKEQLAQLQQELTAITKDVGEQKGRLLLELMVAIQSVKQDFDKKTQDTREQLKHEIEIGKQVKQAYAEQKAKVPYDMLDYWYEDKVTSPGGGVIHCNKFSKECLEEIMQWSFRYRKRKDIERLASNWEEWEKERELAKQWYEQKEVIQRLMEKLGMHQSWFSGGVRYLPTIEEERESQIHKAHWNHDEQVKQQEERIIKCKQRIEMLENLLWLDIEKVDEHFSNMFTTMIDALIDEPIAEDNATFSTTDIADNWRNLGWVVRL